MNLMAIEVRTELRDGPPMFQHTEVRHDAELLVTLRYAASPLEANIVASLLVPGSSTPPRAFWDALDYGDVKPVPVGAKLSQEEASDIRLAEARADVEDRMDAVYAACLKILNGRMDA